MEDPTYEDLDKPSVFELSIGDETVYMDCSPFDGEHLRELVGHTFNSSNPLSEGWERDPNAHFVYEESKSETPVISVSMIVSEFSKLKRLLLRL